MYNANIEQYLDSMNDRNSYKKRLKTFIPLLSIFVILVVFWCLKLTGITMAGEAFCGFEEHEHGEECTVTTLICEESETGSAVEESSTEKESLPSSESSSDETAVSGSSPETVAESDVTETSVAVHTHTDECYKTEYKCGIEEHIHTSGCYSDLSADIETAEVWEQTFADVSKELSLRETVIAIAQTQIGYRESEANFKLDDNNVKQGYTRYGEWYGNPYGEWATMFTAFCIHYAGLDDLPLNAGAESLRSEWDEAGKYEPADGYDPVPGDIVFVDKDANGTADVTAIVSDVSGASITVIEGDLNGQVAENSYETADKALMGYGVYIEEVAEPVKMMSTRAVSGQTLLGTKYPYNAGSFSTAGEFVLYAQGSDGNYYAIDGNANAVQVFVDSSGNITTNSTDPDLLMWTFAYCGTYDNRPSYYIQNVKTNMYLHPYSDDTGNGAILEGRWESALYPDGDGVNFRGARQNSYAWLRQSNDYFTRTGTLNNAATFYFGKAPTRYTVWLDGTLGGLMGLGGSPNEKRSVNSGEKFTLPAEWQSPDKYSYKLQGWYEVRTNKYYRPGEEITVTDDMVLYADWVASTYDVGQYNAQVSDTVSTNDFITTHVFDYNSLFNVMSERVNTSVNASSHNETWELVQSGNVAYKNQETLNFVFLDYDANGDISYANNRNGINTNGEIVSGIYSDRLGEILFRTDNAFDPASGAGIIGKHYLGTADHLFKIDQDPTSEHYGYYYYDSKLNAASYNQTDKRFYVYDYLERTADSEKDGGGGEYSDFLPFNSPYANTNSKTLNYYEYAGENGEYSGVKHVQYDAKYNTNNNSVNNVGTNYAFGMAIDIEFYLPEAPGSKDSNGNYGNQDLYGKDMHFKFSGDDDVWVMLDGKLVLDIGGVHGIESGDINFATGAITVNGTQVATLDGVGEGEHVLTVYYLERGSSQSNCAIYFNLAPRFDFSIQKEDVLTRELLNGAEFSVYTDKECKVPAELWESKEAHNREEASTNVFTVKDGIANIWGFSAGKTYYIKETKPPDATGYSLAKGIISLSLDKRGMASYSVEVIEEKDESGNPINISNGFTVHGFKIDEETQKAFIVVTNAQDWVEETTTVQVLKKWQDNVDHTYDAVTAYLTITDPDGTVRRIREITLSEENDWTYTWTNLPKFYQDGETLIKYGVEEAYKAGYMPSVERLESIVIDEVWDEALSFKHGEEYILGYGNRYLSTTSANADTLMWVDEATAKESPLALWTATTNGNTVKLTNAKGQPLVFNYQQGGSYFNANRNVTSYNLVPTDTGNGMTLHYVYGANQYIGTNLNQGRLMETGNASQAIVFVPKILVTEGKVQDIEDFAYEITNIPLEEETSLKVMKKWDLGMAASADYERAQVTVKLLANGKDTGRTVTLSLKNNWTETFMGLPYKDADGKVIQYTVEESWENKDWLPVYGEVITVGGDIPTYETTVTNSYRWGHGYELPATGGPGFILILLCGLVTVMCALSCIYLLRRKRERGYG